MRCCFSGFKSHVPAARYCQALLSEVFEEKQKVSLNYLSMLLQSPCVCPHTQYRHIYHAQCQLFFEMSENIRKVDSVPKLSLAKAVSVRRRAHSSVNLESINLLLGQFSKHFKMQN